MIVYGHHGVLDVEFRHPPLEEAAVGRPLIRVVVASPDGKVAPPTSILMIKFCQQKRFEMRAGLVPPPGRGCGTSQG